MESSGSLIRLSDQTDQAVRVVYLKLRLDSFFSFKKFSQKKPLASLVRTISDGSASFSLDYPNKSINFVHFNAPI